MRTKERKLQTGDRLVWTEQQMADGHRDWWVGKVLSRDDGSVLMGTSITYGPGVAAYEQSIWESWTEDARRRFLA